MEGDDMVKEEYRRILRRGEKKQTEKASIDNLTKRETKERKEEDGKKDRNREI